MSYAVENATCARYRTSGGPCDACRRVDDVLRLQPVAGDLVDRLVEALAIVGHVDRDRRRPGRDDAEHVAVVDQLLRDLLEQLADAAGVAEVQVQVVDEDQEDAAGGVVGRPRRRQEDAFLHRRRRRRRDAL